MNIIITGASKGIGRETALILNNDPQNKIFAISRNKALLESFKNTGKFPESIYIFPFDLMKFSLYKSELIEEILQRFQKVDVLINNAGLLVNKLFSDQTEEDINHQVDANLKAPLMLTQLLLPYFNVGAHILNISSMGGVQGSVKFPGLSVYSATKGALAVFTESMAEEFRDKGIKSNCLALGAAQTEMLTEAFPAYEAPISASEMGKYVADFAVSGHKYFNGKILPVALTTP